MLVLHSPKSDIFLTTRDQLVRLDWAKLDSEDVEVTDLLGQQFGFFIGLYLTDVEDEDGLSFIGVEADHGKVFLVAESDLLHLLIGTLEAGNALMVDPYPH